MRKRLLMTSGAIMAFALTLTACSGGSGDTSEGEASGQDSAAIVAAAQAELDSYKEIPATDDIGTPIDISSLAGEKIFSIPIDSKLEFYQVGEASMKQIAEEAGLEYTTFPTDGTPTSFQQGFAQAIAQDAGVIMLNGPLPETLEPQIREATDAGIQVIPLHLSDQSEEPLEITPWEAYAPFNLGARLSTLAAVVDLDGEPVKALVIEASSTGPSDGMVRTIEETLADEAPAGSEVVASINSQVPVWSTEIQPAVQSALLKDPSINAIIPIYDSMALFAIPGIEQASPDSDIGVFSFNGTPAVNDLIHEGVFRVNVAENPDWVSYVNLDTAFRAMLGEEPSEKASGPVRVLDASNVDETGTPSESGKGFGEEYPSAYLQLWGVE